MIRVKIQYRDMTEKQCKKFWQDYPEEASSGHKWTDPEILDAVWEQWNNGSGKECALFKKLEVRSMMIGDYVSILRPTVASVWHECLPIGWRINVPWDEVLGNVERKDFSDVSKDDVRKALINKLEQDRWWERMIKNNDILLEDHWVTYENN
jgi:hypothetical protein